MGALRKEPGHLALMRRDAYDQGGNISTQSFIFSSRIG